MLRHLLSWTALAIFAAPLAPMATAQAPPSSDSATPSASPADLDPSSPADLGPSAPADLGPSAPADPESSAPGHDSSADSGQADKPGGAKLREAYEVKLNAQSLGDLERVVRLAEEALDEGLDPTGTQLARDLIAFTLYEHASRLGREIFERQPPNPQWPALRLYALQQLDKALKFNDHSGSIYLLIARLQALPRGDQQAAREALNKAIPLLKNSDSELAIAYLTRAELADKPEEKLEALNKAVELDPSNIDAWRTRGLAFMQQGELEKALDDLLQLLERAPEDLIAHQAVAEVLAQMEQYDKALEHIERVIAIQPNSWLPYLLRANIHLTQDKFSEAIADLDRVLELDPTNINALMLRAIAHARQDNLEAARADVNRALEIDPNLTEAIQQRALILAAEGKFAAAIGDMQRLIRAGVDDPTVLLQLGSLHVAARHPRKAIQVFTKVLEKDPDNARAWRGRADAYLSIGKQAEAIADYERALNRDDKDPGTLNNLAWVLATSPDGDLRDGDRAIDLATKASELTKYQAAHILSTLAAAYAETGNFDKAMEWSQKAVELGGEQIEQLKQELESYRQGKPWRELQQIEERPEDDQPSAADLEPAPAPDSARRADPTSTSTRR